MTRKNTRDWLVLLHAFWAGAFFMLGLYGLAMYWETDLFRGVLTLAVAVLMAFGIIHSGMLFRRKNGLVP